MADSKSEDDIFMREALFQLVLHDGDVFFFRYMGIGDVWYGGNIFDRVH